MPFHSSQCRPHEAAFAVRSRSGIRDSHSGKGARNCSSEIEAVSQFRAGIPASCTFFHDPDQAEIEWISMAEPNTPLPLTASRSEQIFSTLTSAQIARVAKHGRTRTVRSGEVLVEQRGPGHSIFCRHFRRTGGCPADRHNRNASLDCQGRSVHR
jgi:hypothetical protein